jgi:hypothetical protein
MWPSQSYRSCVALVTWAILSSSFVTVSANDVTEPFEGVRLIHSTATTPRLVDMWVVEIDMSAPGLSFLVTPSNGELPGDTAPQTVREFVTLAGAQIGINASFFSYAAKASDGKPQFNVSGLSVSNGDAYSPFAEGFVDAINISRGNAAKIIRGTGKSRRPPAAPPSTGDAKAKQPEIDVGLKHRPAVKLYNALGGKSRLVKNGKNVAGDDPAIHPRTAIGIKQDGKLLLFTVDGRQPGHSLGLKLSEMADILIAFGAHDAINLDGGGSTTLVMDDPATPANDPRVMNRPCDTFPNKERGKERPVGNSLAVFARKRSAPAKNPLVHDDKKKSAAGR